MPSTLGKLGALSQKINPLTAMSSHHHNAQVEVPRSNPTPHPTQASPASSIFKGRWRGRTMKGAHQAIPNGTSESQNGGDYKVDIGDEKSDLLGDIIITGLLSPDGKKLKRKEETLEVTAKLTTKEFMWATRFLKLEDIVAVSYSDGSRRFSIHSFAATKKAWVPGTFVKPCRNRRDMHFLAPNPEDALKWVSKFASQGFFVNCLPHPLSSSKRQGSIIDARDSPPGAPVNCRAVRVMLVVLNPRSGRGRARKVYDSKVEPILKLAGFRLNVVETTGPHHAHKLAAAVDLTTCPDGIICVGGDGIINEVLNGLLSREDAKQSMPIPIGIIPAGSDNSLIWTVMGIRDPVSAAMAIVKGDLVATDVFAVEWIKTGDLHMGLTVAYYGFMSDVLELSEKYQKRFGPLRYFVAGALKLLCLPKYECEVEFLPIGGSGCGALFDNRGGNVEIAVDVKNAYGEGFDRKVEIESVPRMQSNGVSNHESVLMVPCRIGDPDLLTASVEANNESSEYVRGLDAKTKRVPSARFSIQTGLEEALAVHHSLAGPTTPSPRPRTRSKSRIDRGWSGLSSGNGSSRGSWDYSMVDNGGESVGTSADDSPNSLGTKWNVQEGNLDGKNVQEVEVQSSIKSMVQPLEEDKWMLRQGPFLGVMICNHQCKTVQCLESQVLAPTAEHDDSFLDLVMVRGAGRFQLLRFFIMMQFGRHLSLPFVEYTKVRSVKLKPGNNSHKGCGIDGELLSLNGPISTTLLPEQWQLIGRCTRH